jgi:hypothetical protein
MDLKQMIEAAAEKMANEIVERRLAEMFAEIGSPTPDITPLASGRKIAPAGWGAKSTPQSAPVQRKRRAGKRTVEYTLNRVSKSAIDELGHPDGMLARTYAIFASANARSKKPLTLPDVIALSAKHSDGPMKPKTVESTIYQLKTRGIITPRKIAGE